MSNAEANTALLKKCYAAWHETKGGSVDLWTEIFADELDFRSLAMGSHPSANFTNPLSARAEVAGYFEGLLAQWEMVYYAIDRYVAQGDDVCAIGATAWTHKKTGKTVDTPKVDVWSFRDGKAVSFFEYYDTAKLFAAGE